MAFLPFFFFAIGPALSYVSRQARPFVQSLAAWRRRGSPNVPGRAAARAPAVRGSDSAAKRARRLMFVRRVAKPLSAEPAEGEQARGTTRAPSTANAGILPRTFPGFSSGRKTLAHPAVVEFAFVL